jgi:hypothetical protein
MFADKQIEELLHRHKFALVNERKHLKYKNPEGKIFIAAKTPSDWRADMNSLADLRRVIASPVPTSEILEEERQRRELESTIKLQPNVKLSRGLSGSGKKKKSRGTGFIYEDCAKEEPTPEQLEQRKKIRQRMAEREETLQVARQVRRQAEEWSRLAARLKNEERQRRRDLGHISNFLAHFAAVQRARNEFAEYLRGRRAMMRDKQQVEQELEDRIRSLLTGERPEWLDDELAKDEWQDTKWFIYYWSGQCVTWDPPLVLETDVPALLPRALRYIRSLEMLSWDRLVAPWLDAALRSIRAGRAVIDVERNVEAKIIAKRRGKPSRLQIVGTKP